MSYIILSYKINLTSAYSGYNFDKNLVRKFKSELTFIKKVFFPLLLMILAHTVDAQPFISLNQEQLNLAFQQLQFMVNGDMAGRS
jgi:hypothetical protein